MFRNLSERDMNAIICMLIVWFYISLYGILSSAVPPGRLDFDQPCLNVWQKQQIITLILLEITINIPISSGKSLQHIW